MLASQGWLQFLRLRIPCCTVHAPCCIGNQSQKIKDKAKFGEYWELQINYDSNSLPSMFRRSVLQGPFSGFVVHKAAVIFSATSPRSKKDVLAQQAALEAWEI